MTRASRLALLAAVVLVAVGIALYASTSSSRSSSPGGFDGERAFNLVEQQMALGPRPVGSEAHAQVRAWIQRELAQNGWRVRIQEAEALGHPIYNVIADRSIAPAEIILGAHYDTRLQADRDTDFSLRSQPVPGANDGASGVAVLLELARVLPDHPTPSVRLVFFDAEDNGRIPGWDWILGSRAYVAGLAERPEAVVIVDMVGAPELELYYEANSDPVLRESIWKAAARIGHRDVFIPEAKHSILDDHTPFLEAGLPAVDLIGVDYPFWHTTQDTLEHISADSLEAVGETLLHWLQSRTG